MKIRIDGKEIFVSDASKNIVEISEENGIAITAPCFRKGRKGGCCKACVIEVDGAQKYACCTKPQEGMVVEYDRDDLAALRKERLADYAQALLNGASGGSCCGGGDSQDSCCCSGSSCSC